MATAFLNSLQRRAKVEQDLDGLGTVEVRLTVNREQFIRLTHLANATAARNGVPDLILSIVRRLDEAIHRDGSWERCVFQRLFGEALDVAASAMYAAGDQPKLTGGAS